ncbi:uncharacterized protein CANTADRAFT_24936 [Suhomyces tanzawaensis NRRL Y-17324]|uniref:Uncharacterized protein n=1 Tax=Suhomyces tanzawaensis NRRL Y-17324 TaxID=984487 RepID=A0A1E4SSB9_9ASCO|nr:uncharacterized protein CANTADRAFT_24936 [Suhomyces tanzawaensis NRRL Y-17324]ODV82410.1 hypothetical protein CANTADRAFT_24936 [Suhomyces tanzawaensis NRRL Y-17324]
MVDQSWSHRNLKAHHWLWKIVSRIMPKKTTGIIKLGVYGSQQVKALRFPNGRYCQETGGNTAESHVIVCL